LFSKVLFCVAGSSIVKADITATWQALLATDGIKAGKPALAIVIIVTALITRGCSAPLAGGEDHGGYKADKGDKKQEQEDILGLHLGFPFLIRTLFFGYSLHVIFTSFMQCGDVRIIWEEILCSF